MIAELGNALFDFFLFSSSTYDCGIALVNRDLFGAAQLLEFHVFQFDPEILADERASREDRDVAEHRLATIAKSWSFHGTDIEDATQLVYHQSSQRLALDILRDNQQWLARLGGFFENRNQFPKIADFLFKNQNQGILKHAVPFRGPRDEIG